MSQSEEYRLDPKRKYRWRAQIAALSALAEPYRVDLSRLEVLHETEFWCASDQGARARATQWAGRQWKPPVDAAAPDDAGWRFLIPGQLDSHHFRVLPGALLVLRPVVEPVDAEAAAFMEQVRLGGDRALTGRSRAEVLRLLEAYFRQECDNQGGTLTDQLAEDADRAYDLPGAAEAVARGVNWQLSALSARLGQRLELTCPACGHTGFGVVSRVPGGYEEGEFLCDCGTPLQPRTPAGVLRGLVPNERHTYCPRCGPRRTDIVYCSPAGPTRERLPVPGTTVWLECQACHGHAPEPKARTTAEARAEWWAWFRAYREAHRIEHQPFNPDLHQSSLQAALRTAAAGTRLIVLYAAPDAAAVMDSVRMAAAPSTRINAVDMPTYPPTYRRQGLVRLFYRALRQNWSDQLTAELGQTMRTAAGVWVIDHADNLDYASLHALADPLGLPVVVLIARRPALYDELARTDAMWRRAIFVTPAPADVLPPEGTASTAAPIEEAPFPAPGFGAPTEMPPITLGETYQDIVMQAVMDDDDDLAFNPAVTGLLPGEPAVMDEETWIEAACDKINEYGARAFLRRMLDDLRQDLGDEDVYGDEAEEDGEEVEDTLFLSLTTHLLKKQVLGWHTPGAGFPFDALLVFVDGHALPIAWPEGADLPRPAQVNRLEGQYLVAVFFRENAEGEPYVVLCFHAEAEALAGHPTAWDWADVQGRGFVRVPTTAKTAGMIACPVTGEMGDEDLDQDMTAAETVEEHLAGRRVADKLAGSEGTALIFDDAHMLPIMPAPGIELVDAARLEDIVGRFLVLADQDSRDGGRLKLYFHDDPDRLNPVLESTARAPETYEPLITAFLSEPATRLLVIAAESAWHIVCPD